MVVQGRLLMTMIETAVENAPQLDQILPAVRDLDEMWPRSAAYPYSPLEGDGFELLVPRHKNRGFPQGAESLRTLRWREMDSNFQYASTERWHRATDLLLFKTLKRRARLPWRDHVPRLESLRASAGEPGTWRSELGKDGPKCRMPTTTMG
jgi:hypothetical protein